MRGRLEKFERSITSRGLTVVVAMVVGAVALAVAAVSANASVAPAPVADHSIIARDIIPSGEYESIPTASTLPKIEQQAVMYNSLYAGLQSRHVGRSER